MGRRSDTATARGPLRVGEVDFPRVGKPLVPGCGKGYDAIFIASFLGIQTTGFDISPTAIGLANKTLHSNPSPPSNVKFKLRDFLQIKATYDLLYDYLPQGTSTFSASCVG
ncbi:hypothetical protein M422DRAFT_30196 [Sphaerobolus stellatus SS14]|uniref:Methyltransferase domain-containing protein n=1 Tax=Sphaerobolus stellatus (strain SS14) TaxID=990650 RepID=A0A0C9VQT9_SPHS4|nr:hypothetical protein M422DRAFT_30196 [Sphaerobolus stellatus SS14]